MSRAAAPLLLTGDEHDRLARWSQAGPPRLAERARIVLACAQPGSSNAAVAADLGLTELTVGKWRRRFAGARLDGLADRDRPGRPKAGLQLTDEERATLARWARRATSAQALALRARIVLACAGGGDNKQVAAELGIHETTVGKWRSRFAARRLDGLADEDRPGRPRTITGEKVEEVIVATLEQAPPSRDSHWSTRSMARSEGISQTAVSRIWRAFELKPHREQTWKLSADPQFIEKVRDVAGLYLNPPEHALVLCVDEKSQIQAYPGDDPGVRNDR